MIRYFSRTCYLFSADDEAAERTLAELPGTLRLVAFERRELVVVATSTAPGNSGEKHKTHRKKHLHCWKNRSDCVGGVHQELFPFERKIPNENTSAQPHTKSCLDMGC